MNDQINQKELSVILRELKVIQTLNIEGDIVELGCYKGLTSLEIQKLNVNTSKPKTLFLYDSFEGLPPKSTLDFSPAGEQFTAGQLPASKNEVIKKFKQVSLPIPIIKKGWFSDLKPADLPEKISFAFLDGDFYDSILDSLKLVWPKLAKDSVVIIDDYQNEALPGAQKAVDWWLKLHSAKLRVEASLAIIHPIID